MLNFFPIDLQLYKIFKITPVSFLVHRVVVMKLPRKRLLGIYLVFVRSYAGCITLVGWHVAYYRKTRFNSRHLRYALHLVVHALHFAKKVRSYFTPWMFIIYGAFFHFSTQLCHHCHSHHPSLLHFFTPGSKSQNLPRPTFSTNRSHLNFSSLLIGLPSWSRDWTGLITLISLFFSFFLLYFCSFCVVD